LDAMRRDITGVSYPDQEVRETVRDVYQRAGYLLDPHSAIGYMGITRGREGQEGREGRAGIFLATAHPAKVGESVGPILGARVEPPPALAEAMARPRHIVKIAASYEALKAIL